MHASLVIYVFHEQKGPDPKKGQLLQVTVLHIVDLSQKRTA
jgi:hypothetical protein